LTQAEGLMPSNLDGLDQRYHRRKLGQSGMTPVDPPLP
jgi:hypothetical protein